MELKKITDNLRQRLSIDTLTPVQQLTATLSGAEGIRLTAPTGSGKTIAFTIPALERIAQPVGAVQTLAIVPTRELAVQVAETFRAAAAPDLTTAVAYGGHSFIDERNSLAANPDILVATPGRLLDHLERHTFNPAMITTVIFDEYDKSLELGFEETIKKILNLIPRPQAVILTSATTAIDIPAFLTDRRYESVSPDKTESDADDSRGRFKDPSPEMLRVESYLPDKLEVAADLACSLAPDPTIFFVNHREGAERVAAFFKKEGLDVALYHGGLDQRERETALERFTNRSATTLVATDLGARGLDITGVDNIVHYNLPLTAESWTHRNGRTARMGAEGRVFTIISDKDNVADFITWKYPYQPPQREARPPRAPFATLLLSLGKREKISKGDVVGFLTANTSLTGDEIGRIRVGDHSTLVAVRRDKARAAADTANKAKIKNQRVKVTLL